MQDADSADGGADFTSRRRRQPLVERPVEPPEPDGEGSVFCVLDVETTGFSPGRDSIIEIAVIRTERDGVEQVLSELVRPAGNIPRKIREITGITNEMVADAETIDQVLPRVAELVGAAPIVAHNAHFDRRFVEHNARLMGSTAYRERVDLHDAYGPAGSNGRPVQAGGAGREAGRGGAGRAPGARRLPGDNRGLPEDAPDARRNGQPRADGAAG